MNAIQRQPITAAKKNVFLAGVEGAAWLQGEVENERYSGLFRHEVSVCWYREQEAFITCYLIHHPSG